MNNDNGRCFPSVKTLAEECSIGQKTVQRATDALENAGFITKNAGNGRGKATQYTLKGIESCADNRNKHRGNTANLIPNYSSDVDINPDDYSQVDFDDESKTDQTKPEYRRMDVPKNTSNDPVLLLDEYYQPISLAEIPESERSEITRGLLTLPAASRRRCLKQRIDFIRRDQNKSLQSTLNHNTSNPTGSYDELNEISQEANDDPDYF